MKMITLLLTGFMLLMLLCASCTAAPEEETTGAPAAEATAIPDTPQAELPNPASVYCEEQGNVLEIQTAEDGSQTGVCQFPDGSECEEWAFFRQECALPARMHRYRSPPESPPPRILLKSPPRSRIHLCMKVGGNTPIPNMVFPSCCLGTGLPRKLPVQIPS